jgi:uncharacterized protein (DUF983 family)
MTAPAPTAQALGGLCPRCGRASAFAGWLRFAERCPACGLEIASYNVGDGPAAFLTLGIGTLVTILAVTLELAAAPPWWLHLLLWPPVTAIAVAGSLRVAKAWLLGVEYRREAREGRRTDRA